MLTKIKINNMFIFLSKIRLLIIIILIITSTSCSILRTNINSTYKSVIINEPGEIYSTYGLTDNENAKQKILENGISKELLIDICKYSEEHNWPLTLKTLDGRLRNRESIINYKARLVTSFDNICIISIPYNENKKAPKGMILKRDFYIIIDCDAIYINNVEN